MEDKTTEWLLTLLSYRKEQIPILNTIFIRDDKACKYIFNDVRETIKEKTSKPIAAIIQSLLSTQLSYSSILCCFIKNSHRKFFNKHDLKTIVSKKMPKLDQIQLCYTIQGIQSCPTYVFCLYFNQNKYTSKLFSKQNNQLDKIKNSFTHNYAKEIAYVILKAVESEENKRVLKLEIEFVKDSNGKLYLHQINECKIIKMNKLQNSNFNSLDDLNYFISQFHEKKTKKFYESPGFPVNADKVRHYSRISIDSIPSEDEENQEANKIILRPNSRNSMSSRSSIDRLSRRTSSIKQESMIPGRLMRKSAVFVGTLKERKYIHDEDTIEDSWDYGHFNVHFLEVISRQMIRENNPKRSNSPGLEEIKQQMRLINEKLSLAPICGKTFDYNYKGFPLIKVSSDPMFLNTEATSTRVSMQRSPSLFGKLQPITMKRFSYKEIPKKLTRGVLSQKRVSNIYKTFE